MKRRLRKFPQHHPSEGEQQHHGSRRRVPYGLIWLVLTVIVLVLVILYDRRSISDAEQHIMTGRELEKKGLYVEALEEYEQAVKNRRLGRKARAGAALSMAEIYYKHLEDYPAAHTYYVQAKQESPAVFNDKEMQERARLASTRAQGPGVFRSRMSPGVDGKDTTRTIVQRVELISEPLADRQGPVLATFNGGELNAGQVLRELRTRPEFHSPELRENPAKLREYVENVLRMDLAYQAAVSSGVNKDPDVSERLYDYQKQLVTQRYLVDRRDLAMKVDNAQVEKYYNENKANYVKPGTIELAMIKAETETSATELLQMLRDGAPFHDLATSYSVDDLGARPAGIVGRLTEGDTRIPGIGVVPDLIQELFKLPVHTVTDVVEVSGSHYIFKINSVMPAVNVSLDEARGQIENLLRGQAVDVAKHRLDQELNEAFEPKLNEEALKRFWEYVAASHVPGDKLSGVTMQTTGSAVATTAPAAATTATESETTAGATAGR